MTLSSIKLELGKRYLNRVGEVVEIVEHTPNRIHEFWGDNGESYTESGVHDQFHEFEPPNPRDLVKEV